MPKPNSSSTVKELKDYIKSHKLNHPEVKLSMRKSELQAGLKKIGHWSGARPGGRYRAPCRKERSSYISRTEKNRCCSTSQSNQTAWSTIQRHRWC